MEIELAGHVSMYVDQVKHNQQTDDELGKLGSQLGSADAKVEASPAAAKLTNSLARQAADAASKTMKLAQHHQKELKGTLA